MDVFYFVELIDREQLDFLFSLLTFILIASVIDFLFGWINAQFNKEVVFVSEKALYGIVKKMMYFIVLVLFLYIAYLISPPEIAFTATFGLYGGYLLSELYSVLGHLNLVDDQKENELFSTFLKKIFYPNDKEEE